MIMTRSFAVCLLVQSIDSAQRGFFITLPWVFRPLKPACAANERHGAKQQTEYPG